jgi:tRNA uridine 5-carboxymethylaminomethyl modification enzyme
MHGTSWDVVVIGGGHAGCEAAAAAARCGVRTLLLTQKISTIGVMSCNPSIGGVGKGHLVREIDALGGVMGLAADEGGIQFRVLNESKGPAVRGPRAQMDRLLYKAAVLRILQETPNLTIAEGSVKDLILGDNGAITGVSMGADGHTSDVDWSVRTGRVIVTTGTFLRGMIHVGRELTPAGRAGDPPSTELADTFARVGFKMGRLKTGTPPRIKGSTIDTSQMEVQHGDEPPQPFSFLNKEPKLGNKVLCWSTRTNTETHRLVQHYRSESPVFDGAGGKGHGPRYCPSLDVKVSRFPDRTHLVWLEPEGLDTDVVYPNGISMGFPFEIQKEIVHSIQGLEHAELLHPAYSIEYDYVDPRQVHSFTHRLLETKAELHSNEHD